MHRFIMQPPHHLIVDHKNGNKLDNRKSNLRICNHQQNNRNQRPKRNHTSGYKGVRRGKMLGSWDASITIDRKEIYIARFYDKLDAVQAYNTVAEQLFGEFACLNEVD
jgi:hypothetical protein